MGLVTSIRLRVRLVRLPGVWETLYWSLHTWRAGYRLPTDLTAWSPQAAKLGSVDDDLWDRELSTIAKMWTSLAPFFASKGYHLYEWTGEFVTLPPSTFKRPRQVEQLYPYARHFIQEDRQYEFWMIQGGRNWAARDNLGREVMIRMAQASDQVSEELKVYQRLNTPEAKADPRNHTLPVIDWIIYDGITFVVMPRWDSLIPGPKHKFPTIEALFHFADSLLEGLIFLHDQRVAHRDFALQNIVMDGIAGPQHEPLECDPQELLGASVVRYAVIDYDISVAFPLDTDITSVKIDRAMRLEIKKLRLGPGLSNPFGDDVLTLINVLQCQLRVVENVVPQVAEFFDNALADKENPPMASEVYERFKSLRSRVTREQLLQPPPGTTWRGGKVYP